LGGAGGPGSLAMQPAEPGFSTDGLPRAFLQSLRTLFDILDELSDRGGIGVLREPPLSWPAGEPCCAVTGACGDTRRAGMWAELLGALKAVLPEQVHRAGAQTGVSGNIRGRCPPGCPGGRVQVRGAHLVRLQFVLLRLCWSSAREVPAQGNSAEPSDPRSLVMNTGAVPRPDSSSKDDSSQPDSAACSAEGGVLPRSQSETATGLAGARRHGRSRDEQRRHTITSGVDYGMLKQMKELEQEKDSLLAGLELLERARDWYQQQIHSVTERQRLVGQSAHSTEFLAESGQSRLGVLLPRLQEVTRCLGELLSCPAGPFSLSPSTLAPSGSSNPQHGPPNLPHPQQAVQRLKDQNRLLTKEVTEKSERITQLEQEKSALIKQLFEARARGSQEGGALDSTFI
uniref:Suppressor APC domain containing 2 n=1 Tax=Lepisosteus oculatus TaxID=7918 RepID=W5LYH8_LEPOC